MLRAHRFTAYGTTYVLIFAAIFSCATLDRSHDDRDYRNIDFRGEMKALIVEIAETAKAEKPSFGVIVNNGEELVTRRGTSTSAVDSVYAAHLDGFLIESLFFGYSGIDNPTPVNQRNTMLPYLLKLRNADVPVLVIDYCAVNENREESMRRNREFGFLSFPAPRRELDIVPSRDQVRADFLYLINPGRFDTLDELVSELIRTDAKLIFIDLYYAGAPVPREAIEKIRNATVPPRKVYAYMSVGEASTWRYYWSLLWDIALPEWVVAENPFWPGSYRVTYWHESWKQLLVRGSESYLSQVMNAGYDGVILDGVDTYQYFEAEFR